MKKLKYSIFGSECDPGGHLGLQSRLKGRNVFGEFDSHALPPFKANNCQEKASILAAFLDKVLIKINN